MWQERKASALQGDWGWELQLQSAKVTLQIPLGKRGGARNSPLPLFTSPKRQGLGGTSPGHSWSLASGTSGFRGGSDGKESACNAGDPGSNPALGRSPGEEKGDPL